jgi:hypothetical protein
MFGVFLRALPAIFFGGNTHTVSKRTATRRQRYESRHLLNAAARSEIASPSKARAKVYAQAYASFYVHP